MSTVIPRRKYNELIANYAKDKYMDAVISMQLEHYRMGQEPPDMTDTYSRKLYKSFRDEAKAVLPYEPEPIAKKKSESDISGIVSDVLKRTFIPPPVTVAGEPSTRAASKRRVMMPMPRQLAWSPSGVRPSTGPDNLNEKSENAQLKALVRSLRSDKARLQVPQLPTPRPEDYERFKRLYEEQKKISELRSKRIKDLNKELEEAKKKPLSNRDAKYFEEQVRDVVALQSSIDQRQAQIAALDPRTSNNLALLREAITPSKPKVAIPQAALDIQDRIMGSARRAIEAEKKAKISPKIVKPISRIPQPARPTRAVTQMSTKNIRRALRD